MRKFTLFLFTALITASAFAQNVGINSDGAAPHPSAQLDVSSTTKGFLPPRMTESQRGLIDSPAAGLLVYQTDGATGYYFFNGTVWVSLSPEAINLALSAKVDKEADKQLSSNDFTDADKTKLDALTLGGETNVQADWAITDNTSDAYILNKPELGTAAELNSGTNAGEVLTFTTNGTLPALDGSQLTNLNLNPALTVGDIKYGYQTTDHNGWFLLNGRNKASLNLTPAQLTNWNALFSTATSLPSANGRYLAYSTADGALYGSNAFNLSVGNLPTNTFTAYTDYTNGGTIAQGGYGLIRRTVTTNTSTIAGGVTDAGGSGNEPDLFSTPQDHYHSISFRLNTGSQNSIDNRPASLNVRVFVYLGQ
jgi:hypothetical protein